MRNILFIGGGNMASALIGGLLNSGFSASQIFVLDPSEQQRIRLSTLHAISVISRDSDIPSAVDVVVWAIKPQIIKQTIFALADYLKNALHISVAAGVTAKSLVGWLGTDRVVRAMPNTPALVGKGVVGLFAWPAVNSMDKEFTASILCGAGKIFWVDSDERISAITAVSGSGPAYVFHFIESLQSAAENLGFSEMEARELAILVADGAVSQARFSNESISLLRERVTSPGGTTAAALRVLEDKKAREIIIEAVSAAYERSLELELELSVMVK